MFTTHILVMLVSNVKYVQLLSSIYVTSHICTSNIIKGKIQHDQTFAVAAATATANQFYMCNVAKSKQENRVAKKLGVWLEVG